MIKSYPLVLFIFLICGYCHSQSIGREVVASGGNFVSNSSGSISYTIGETVTPTLSGGGHIVTQGFQQPSDILIGLLDIEKDAFGAFSVYPVPAVSKLWFGYEFPGSGLVKVELFDEIGQKLNFNLSESYESGKVVHSFDCTGYASATYVIVATFTGPNEEKHIFSKKFTILN